MGCRLSGPQNGHKNRLKGRGLTHQHDKDELNFLDKYGQPIPLHIEKRKGRSRWQHLLYTTDCSAQAERHREALRTMRLEKRSIVAVGNYDPGPCYDHMTLPPDLYAADLYWPSVSYILDSIDRLGHEDNMPNYQLNAESCLNGCCPTDKEPGSILRQPVYDSPWLDRPLSYPLLHELDSGLGCTDGSLQQMELSEGETDGLSSQPCPTSPGSSPSSGSIISSEPSDSGFHSVSTGENRSFNKVLEGRAANGHTHGHLCRHKNLHFRGHSPLREQRGCWDLESIPEATFTSDSQPHQHQCNLGSTTVQLHRAHSPNLPLHPPHLSTMVAGCRTEPCQRRALRLEKQQMQSSSMELPGRSHTMFDLTEGKRAIHPHMDQRGNLFLSNMGPGIHALGQRDQRHLHQTIAKGDSCEATREHDREHDEKRRADERRVEESMKEERWGERKGRERRAVGSGWLGFQTLDHQHPHSQPGPSNTMATPPCSPRSSSSPPSKSANPRALRNQLLKARASRLADERNEVTTDEEVNDSTGEGWAVRYLSRPERRRNLAVARERRKEGEKEAGGVETQADARAGYDRVSVGPVFTGVSVQTVLELSHKKQSRLRNIKLLDDWTTMEELLTHGTRLAETDSVLSPSPLLSVTTV